MALPKQIMKRLIKQTKQKISEIKKDEIEEAIIARKKELNKIGKVMEPEDRITIEEDLVSAAEVEEYQRKAFLLENNLKNFVIRKLDEIREKKQNKSIKESVEALIKKEDEKNQKVRTKIRKMILRKYEETAAAEGVDDLGKDTRLMQTIDEREQAIEEQNANSVVGMDPLYNRIDMNLDRLLKMMTGHS